MVESRNQADMMVAQVEKNLQEHGDKIDASTKSDIEAAVADVKSKKEGDDLEALKSSTEKLSQLLMKIGETIYKATNDANAAAGAAGAETADQAGSSAKPEEDIVDADFEDVNHNDKKSS